MLGSTGKKQKSLKKLDSILNGTIGGMGKTSIIGGKWPTELRKIRICMEKGKKSQ